jgi:hypothetical protein
VAFTASVENAAWLSVAPSSGHGYTELQAHVDPSNLAPGSYFWWIVITAPEAINSPLKLPVRLLIPQPRFNIFPAALIFSEVSGFPSAPGDHSGSMSISSTQVNNSPQTAVVSPKVFWRRLPWIGHPHGSAF